MTTKEIGISLHGELDRREKLIAQLQTECDSIRTVLGIIERPTPEAHNRVTTVVGRGRRVGGGKRATEPKPSTTEPKRAVQTESVVCEKCGETFGNTKALGSHKRWRHGAVVTKSARPDNKPDPPKPNGHADNRVKCDECDERFPDARSMGIHKTRVHFGRSSATGSALGGL